MSPSTMLFNSRSLSRPRENGRRLVRPNDQAPVHAHTLLHLYFHSIIDSVVPGSIKTSSPLATDRQGPVPS